MGIFGVAAGWTSENTAGAMLVLTAAYIILSKIKKSFIPKWQYSGLAGAVIGFSIMILAPGNAMRAASLPFTESENFVEKIGSRLKNLIFLVKSQMSVLLLITIICLVLYFLFKMYKSQMSILPFLYGAGGALALGANILAPVVPARSLFGAAIMFYIAIAYVFNYLGSEVLKKEEIKIIITALLYICTIPSLAGAYADIKSTYDISSYREMHIKLEKNNGFLDISVPMSIPATKYNALYQLEDIQPNKDNWVNQAVCKYFGINSITSYNMNTIGVDASSSSISELPEVPSIQEMYNGMILDFCNGINVKNQGVIEVDGNSEIFDLRGWAADFKTKKPLGELYIQIGNKLYNAQYGLESPSVYDFYKNSAYKNVGFNFQISVSKLIDEFKKTNSNEIYFIMIGTDGTYKFAPVKYEVRITK